MRAIRWLWAAFAALALALGLGTSLPAAAVAPGSYQILAARWGTSTSSVDVTGQIVQYARSGSHVQVNVSSMRVDPAVGAHKTLRIFAREANGSPRTFDIGEGGWLNAADFAAWNGGTGGYVYGWDGAQQQPGYGQQPYGQQSYGQGGDRGQYQILNARYGTARRNIDVTGRLQQIAARDQQLRITNDLFGDDPDIGNRKTLRIFARDANGATRTFEYGERDLVDGALFTGWNSGNWNTGGSAYGWDGNGIAGDQGQYVILGARYGTPNRNIDVTDRLKSLARNDSRFSVTNNTFGDDPDVGAHKTLRIYARGPDGATRLFEYGENGTVDGAQFVGWRQGNWGHQRRERWEVESTR